MGPTAGEKHNRRVARLAAVRAATSTYLEGNHAPPMPNPQDFLTEASNAIEQGNYSKAELLIDFHRDYQRGVTSHRIEENEALELPIVVIDERRKSDIEKDTFENWAVMGLSYFQIAERMLEMEYQEKTADPHVGKGPYKRELERRRSEIRQQAQFFLQSIQEQTNAILGEMKNLSNRDLQNPKIREAFDEKMKEAKEAAKSFVGNYIRQELVPRLAEGMQAISGSPEIQSNKTLLKDMIAIKDFGNMDDKPWTMVTLTEHNDYEGIPHCVAMTDMRLYELTDTQTQWFRDINDRNGQEPQWFKESPPLIQKALRYYAPQILEGRAMPTQLLKSVPGVVRNADDIRGDLYSTTGEFEETFHIDTSSGNFAHELELYDSTLTPEDHAALVSEVFNQVKELTGAAHVYLNTLLSKNPVRAAGMKAAAYLTGEKKQDEGDLYKHLNAATTHRSDATLGNIPVNSSRRIESTQTGVIVQLDRDAKEFILAAYESLDDLERRNTSPSDKEKADIAQAKRLIIALQEARDEFQQLRPGSQAFDEDNINLQLVGTMKQMVSLMRLYNETMEGKIDLSHTPVLFTPCKSGKDRAGLAKAVATVKALTHVLAKPKIMEGRELNITFQRACNRAAGQEQAEAQRSTSISKGDAKASPVNTPQTIEQDAMKKLLPRIGRIASRESRGCEGVKDGEGITPGWIAPSGSEEEAKVKRDTAKYNSKLPKDKSSSRAASDSASDSDPEYERPRIFSASTSGIELGEYAQNDATHTTTWKGREKVFREEDEEEGIISAHRHASIEKLSDTPTPDEKDEEEVEDDRNTP